MKLTRISMATGQLHTQDLPITLEQLQYYENNDVLIQDAFPDLSPSQREFIMTGILYEEWNDIIENDLDLQESDFE